MNNNNPTLENLQNRTVQNLPVKLIYADSDFAVFDKGTTEFYGEYDEYISDQPIDDKIIWHKDLTEADLKKLPAVFSCKLGIMLNQVFYTIYSKKKMRQALQSPAHEAALIDRLMDSMKTKATLAINEKIVEVLSDKDNYNANAWQEISSDEANIDSQDKVIAFLKLIKRAYNAMDTVSTDYNKGYQKPGNSAWNQVLTNCETPKSKVFTIDPDLLDDLNLYFLSDVNRDSELNPHKIFKKVIPKKLKNGVLCAMNDEKSVVYRIINDDGVKEAETLGGGMKKFAWEIEVVGGMIPFTNSWALVKKEKGKATASGSK